MRRTCSTLGRPSASATRAPDHCLNDAEVPSCISTRTASSAPTTALWWRATPSRITVCTDV